MSSDKFLDRQLITTADGSKSIFLPDLNENYHSIHGAVQESQHVFMKMGWEKIIPGKSHVDILEVGFGTGLNAWLVFLEVKRNRSLPVVHYTGLELYPVTDDLARQLNYASAQESNAFMSLHEAEWNRSIELNPKFTLEKRQADVRGFLPERTYDLVFFDAFAPLVQPEMWTKEVFERLYGCMNEGGILVTYCAKGEVRRNMVAAGFSVEKLPGPPGKREMLRSEK